jgi:hypothetical protein
MRFLQHNSEEFYLLGYNAAQSGDYSLLHAGFLITLLYELQDGDVLLRNVG